MPVTVRFLGTNGWYSTETGRTTCVLIDTPKAQILLDAGDGLQRFRSFADPNKPVYLFISHAHLDHLYGIHLMNMFGCMKAGGLDEPVKIKSLTICCQPGFKEKLEMLFERPFTAGHKEMDFPVEILELPKQKRQEFPEFRVTPFLLEHSDPDFGYRIEAERKMIFYTGDTGMSERTAEAARGADLLIHECSFPPGVTSSWGHVNPEQAAEVAKKASVKRLALVHFDAFHYKTLEMRKHAETTAKKIFPNTIAATDGLVLVV